MGQCAREIGQGKQQLGAQSEGGVNRGEAVAMC